MPYKDPEVKKQKQREYHLRTYPITRKRLWHDDTHAECKTCSKRLPKETHFYNALRGGRSPWKKGKRNVGGNCKQCKYEAQSTPENLAKRRRQDRKRRRESSIEELSYQSYKYKVGKANVDITFEE